MGLLRVCADVVLIGADTFRATLDHLWTPAHARRRGDHPGHLPDPRGELMPDVLMPRLSDTMEEGVLSQWVKREGDQVRKGDVLAVIETDKAAMDMEAYDEGVLTRILVQEGASVPIGTPIAVIGEAAAAATAPSPVPAPDQAERAVVPAPALAPPTAASPAGRLPASPLARKLARERGVDLSTVSGSGPGGRIVRADIENGARERGAAQPVPQPTAPTGPARPSPGSPSAAPLEGVIPSPIPSATSLCDATGPGGGRRGDPADHGAPPHRAAARRQRPRGPHFYLTVVFAADDLLAFRAQANQRHGADLKITVTDLLARACATALSAHPEVNVSWDETRILRYRHVNIGIAVAIDDGLIVPVIRDADRKTVTEIAREAHDLTTRARARKLTRVEPSGAPSPSATSACTASASSPPSSTRRRPPSSPSARLSASPSSAVTRSPSAPP